MVATFHRNIWKRMSNSWSGGKLFGAIPYIQKVITTPCITSAASESEIDKLNNAHSHHAAHGIDTSVCGQCGTELDDDALCSQCERCLVWWCITCLKWNCSMTV